MHFMIRPQSTSLLSENVFPFKNCGDTYSEERKKHPCCTRCTAVLGAPCRKLVHTETRCVPAQDDQTSYVRGGRGFVHGVFRDAAR